MGDVENLELDLLVVDAVDEAADALGLEAAVAGWAALAEEIAASRGLDLDPQLARRRAWAAMARAVDRVAPE